MENPSLTGIHNDKQLKAHTEFSFSVFSDNEGDSPAGMKSFSHMINWIKSDNDAFVIGLGDHVKKKGKDEFITFLHDNQWWQDHFYPCAADGENQYYGSSQADWGAGRAFFKEVSLQKRQSVTIRDNGVEYYARIPVKDWTVHLIMLHYPDQPPQDSIAFKSDSKAYLISTINSISKGKHDIIIACAHSQYGFWIDQLSPSQRKTVMEKCDLVLSGTTHFFSRKEVPGFEDHGALVLNTGSITRPLGYCPPGYLHVSVLQDGKTMVVQYSDASKGKETLQKGEYTFVKYLGGL